MKSSKSLLELLNIEELSPEEQEEMLLDLNEVIFKGTLVRLMELMDDKTRDAFNTLMATDPSEEDVEAFLEKNVPNADTVVQDTIDELTSDILASTE